VQVVYRPLRESRIAYASSTGTSVDALGDWAGWDVTDSCSSCFRMDWIEKRWLNVYCWVQDAPVLQRGCAMLRVTERLAKSLEVIQGHLNDTLE